MSDLRFDPLQQVWVAIARNRLQRPTEYIPIEQVQQQLLCPFCHGNEDETPRQVAAYGADGQVQTSEAGNWSTRVVPNKYPSFAPQDEDTKPAVGGPYPTSTRAGCQELIIPTPRHVDSLSALTDTELRVAMTACRDRLATLQAEDELSHGMLFMNCRSAAGASLSHIHLQLIGSPVLSPNLESRWHRDEASLEEKGRTVIQGLADWEREQQVRVVRRTEHFDVFCPFASRFPLQIYLVPSNPVVEFSQLRDSQLFELGVECRLMVQGLESILDQPAYNILLHTAPFAAAEPIRRSWYLELFPRITCTAGFEWGTDTWVNPVSPEAAAKRLKAFQDETVR